MKNNNKYTRKDYIYLSIIILAYLLIVFLLTKNKYIFGSTVDWSSQHIILPEYFRNLFYNTHDFFPDFAANIGNGQNIYNFAYYGLLNPIILFSYLLPFVKMSNYIIISTILSVLVSSVLLYKWLRNKGYNEEIVFISVFLFTLASPLTFHSHRHIMFINYMPFLILGLFGVDQKLEKNKNLLLIASVFLIIMTSFYFSIPSIIVLCIYGVYRYLQLQKNIKSKTFLIDALKFITPFIIAILLASILLLPMMEVVLNNRSMSPKTVPLKSILTIFPRFMQILYQPYGIGLPSIVLLSLTNLILYKKNKSNLFLGISLILVVFTPLITYLLNGGMYLNYKILIPFLPLLILSITIFIDTMFNKEIKLKKINIITIAFAVLTIFNYKEKYIPESSIYFTFVILTLIIIGIGLTNLYYYFYKKTNNKLAIILPICLISLITSFSSNLAEKNFILKKNNINKYVEYIQKHDTKDFYRISNRENSYLETNKVYNTDYYNSTLYSSTYNQLYNKFYFDVFNNEIKHRNRAITPSTNNTLYLMFTNNKYIISKSKDIFGYKKIKTIDNINIFENDNVLPYAYATSKIINEKEFDKIEYPYNIEKLFNNVVVDNKTNTNSKSVIKKENINMQTSYLIKTNKKMKYKIKIPEYLKNKILFIRLNIEKDQPCIKGDLFITIDKTKNKLTCHDWVYHNENFKFDYVIMPSNNENLTINLSKGNFDINNVELFSIDSKFLEKVNDNKDKFYVDKDKTKQDDIYGKINVTNDGYFVTTIPYDKGFKIEIDNSNVKYVKVNKAFVGFKIAKGEHNIKISYKAPGKKLGTILSLIGLLLTIIVGFYGKYFLNFSFNKSKNNKI